VFKKILNCKAGFPANFDKQLIPSGRSKVIRETAVPEFLWIRGSFECVAAVDDRSPESIADVEGKRNFSGLQAREGGC
jgi:hypothetical protein